MEIVGGSRISAVWSPSGSVTSAPTLRLTVQRMMYFDGYARRPEHGQLHCSGRVYAALVGLQNLLQVATDPHVVIMLATQQQIAPTAPMNIFAVPLTTLKMRWPRLLMKMPTGIYDSTQRNVVGCSSAQIRYQVPPLLTALPTDPAVIAPMGVRCPWPVMPVAVASVVSLSNVFSV